MEQVDERKRFEAIDEEFREAIKRAGRENGKVERFLDSMVQEEASEPAEKEKTSEQAD